MPEETYHATGDFFVSLAEVILRILRFFFDNPMVWLLGVATHVLPVPVIGEWMFYYGELKLKLA